MLNNFIETGIKLSHVDILLSIERGSEIPENWKLLENVYPANFYFYEDTRKGSAYISSIRPHILKKHFRKNPNLKNETLFYHDCDMIFTCRINLSQFEDGDNWYGSDCRDYLGYKYILEKGEDVLKLMCNTCSIEPELVRKNWYNCIGAQYIIKEADWKFWDAVEKNSVKLFTRVTKLNSKKVLKNPDYHPVQIWCADMWALLWEAWKRGHKTIAHADLRFSWSTSTEDEWNSNPIFHNAGVTSNSTGFFYKGAFIDRLPYGEEIEIKEKTASKKYWELIQRVSKRSVLTS